jgi:integrase/recombinase XerD
MVDLAAFVRTACGRLSLASSKLLVTALRSLVGYVHVEGLMQRSLASAVPSVAGSKLASLLQGYEVERPLAACDRRTRASRRDFAMLLVRLGLRAGEVRKLSLDDVDWRAAELVVRGKG